MTTTHIGSHPHPDMYAPGLEIDCQCARCGSSMHHVSCGACAGEGLPEYPGEDPEDECEECRGLGGWWECLSSSEWCEGNPLPGREDVARGAIKWFTHKEPA